jgi:hypothetical protein
LICSIYTCIRWPHAREDVDGEDLTRNVSDLFTIFRDEISKLKMHVQESIEIIDPREQG